MGVHDPGGVRSGWLALLGGGEFSFGETLEADRAWLEKTGAGPIGFIPAASDSSDYGRYFTAYMAETFGREVEVIPIYRSRDARRGKNSERIAQCPAVYLGGGVADHLLDALRDSPALEALTTKLREGGMVVAIAAAAQACGHAVRSIFGGRTLPGFDWIAGCAIETNFDPAHDRRLRKLLETPGISGGLGIASRSAVLLGPQRAQQVVGTTFVLDGPEGDLRVVTGS